MAEIKPFRGLRYTGAAGPAGTLTCPPADGAEAGPYSAGRTQTVRGWKQALTAPGGSPCARLRPDRSYSNG